MNDSKRILNQIIGHHTTIQKGLSLIKSQRLPNSLLMVGTDGAYKKQVALGWAQAFFCESDKSACGVCKSCRKLLSGSHEGLIVLSPQNNQIKIDSVRDLIRSLSLASWGVGRIVIIEAANLLNPQAANALLKSIEEPPADTHFFLLVPSQDSVLKTIRSRSQVVRFGELTAAEKQRVASTELNSALVAEKMAFSERQYSLFIEILMGEMGEAIDHCREQVTDRESALEAVHCWQEFIRDGIFQRSQLSRPSHDNLDYSSILNFDDRTLMNLGQRVLRLEQDLQGHCDFGLAFENFIYQSRIQLGIQI